MIHKHKYELDSFTLCINGLVAPFGHCINIYKCKECKKLKIGEVRKLTKEECLFMANRYKEKIENDRDIIRQEIVKDFEDLNKAGESVDMSSYKDFLSYTKRLKNKIKQQDKKISLLEKALELACLSLRSKCDYCKYKDDKVCPPDHHCSNLVVEYFKEQAKEMIKSE